MVRSLATAALCAAGIIGFMSTAAAQAVPELPPAIDPGALKPYLEVPAKGVQIYLCSKTTSGSWAWTFKAPEAELFDTAGARIGKHYGGPTWEGADGGKVVGAVKGSADAPIAGAVSWLLLDIKSRDGNGKFTEAAGILRARTAGGKAPSTGCSEAQSGAELGVPYTATYYFLK